MAEADDDQIEALKAWWNEYGNSLIISVVVVLVVVFGYRAWENSMIESAESASSMYEDLSTSISTVDTHELSDEVLVSARSLGDKLKIEHGDTAYAQFGALFMAKLAMDNGEFDVAEAELRWVLENDNDDNMEIIARMRLARVLAAQGRVDEGLLILSDDVDPLEHRSSWNEVRGDLYYQLGDTAEARMTYQKAFDAVDENQTRPLLKMKLEDLAQVAVVVNVADETESEDVQ